MLRDNTVVQLSWDILSLFPICHTNQVMFTKYESQRDCLQTATRPLSSLAKVRAAGSIVNCYVLRRFRSYDLNTSQASLSNSLLRQNNQRLVFKDQVQKVYSREKASRRRTTRRKIGLALIFVDSLQGVCCCDRGHGSMV